MDRCPKADRTSANLAWGQMDGAYSMPGSFFDVHAKSLAGRSRSGARAPIAIDCVPGGFMEILAAIKREEKKLEKQLGKLQHQLNGIRAAAKALGHSVEREVIGVKKRTLSAAGRAAIVKAAKKRWAKVRKQAK